MPCGGIYPGGPFGSELREPTDCWVCHKSGCLHFVEEWDTPIHARCVPEFLASDEGLCVIRHEHEVVLDFSLEAK